MTSEFDVAALLRERQQEMADSEQLDRRLTAGFLSGDRDAIKKIASEYGDKLREQFDAEANADGEDAPDELAGGSD